jgi:UrcA family protein
MSFQSTQSLHTVRMAAVSRHVALVALAGAAMFTTVASAHARDATTHEWMVSYADLNLSKSSDAAVLYTRLRLAADAVCGEYNIRDLRATQLHAACAQQAVSAAVASVNQAELSAVHAGDKRIRVASQK